LCVGASPLIAPEDPGVLELDSVPLSRAESEEKYGPSAPSTPFNLLPPPSIALSPIEPLSRESSTTEDIQTSACSSPRSSPLPSPVYKATSVEDDPLSPPHAPRASSSRGSNSFEPASPPSDSADSESSRPLSILSSLQQP